MLGGRDRRGLAVSQLDLFDAPATRGAHRRSDPATSISAARSVNTQRQRDQIMRQLLGSSEGMTADDLAAGMRPRPHRSSVASRLALMADDGLVYAFGQRVNDNHRPVQVWFARARSTVDVESELL